MKSLVFGSLFSGVGGLDLGLEQVGHKCAWQVEADGYCRAVLSRHWPSVPKFCDVRDVGAHNLAWVDAIVGGFPCQDISSAGTKLGIKDGTRSGLWSEFFRIICELRPRIVVVENVEALRHKGRGLDRVLRDLASVGMDARWDCLPASAFGAPHRRDRLFIVAYARSERRGDALCQNLFAAVHRDQFSAWQTKELLERASIAGTSYVGLPENLRMGDGVAAWMDDSLRSDPRAQRIAMKTDAKSVPWGQERVKGCGNAVAPPVAAHVGRSISKWLDG